MSKENKELKSEVEVIYNEWKRENKKVGELQTENNALKRRVSSLTSEIENIYKYTKECFKDRTNDLEAFKNAFGRWVDKIKKKIPLGQLKHVLDRLEAKESKFSLERVAELDKMAKSQKSAKKRNMDLER